MVNIKMMLLFYAVFLAVIVCGPIQAQQNQASFFSRSRLAKTKESLKKSATVAAEGLKGAAYLAKEKVEQCPVLSSALQQTRALREISGKVAGLAGKLGLSAAYGVALYNSLTIIKHELETTKKAISFFIETAQDAKEVAVFLKQFQGK